MSLTNNKSLCLADSPNGAEFMRDFDSMPKMIRKRLRDSNFNLCAFCVWMVWNEHKDFARTIAFINTAEKTLSEDH